MKKLVLALLFLSGCTVGPVYKPPEVQLPCKWHAEGENQDFELVVTESTTNQIPFWEKLDDPVLSQLISYAYSQNLDMQIAALRILQARTEANAKKGDLYPRLDGSANYGHVYYSKNALVNGLLGNVLSCNSNHVKRHVNFYELGFDAEWEIDLFGMTKHEIKALQAHEEGVQEDLCQIWVTLSAEIAKNYVELRGLQAKYQLWQDTQKTLGETDVLTKQLLERGLVQVSEVYKIEIELNETKAEIPIIEINMAKSIHRISILLGLPPGELFDCLEEIKPLPELNCQVDFCLPSELLRRRPDIRKAERELAASTERVGSAIAALFPRFSLRGFIGDISTHAGSLFSPASATWLAGPQFLVPIFNSRLLLQDVEYNKIAVQEALLNYQKKVLEALEESENAILNYKAQYKRLGLFHENMIRNKLNLAHAEQLYEEGVNDNIVVGNIRKAHNLAEQTWIQSKVEFIISYIALYKAMGGTCSCE